MVPIVWKPPSDEKMGQFGQMNLPTAGPRSDEQLPRGEHPLQLYSLGTPNGQKVTIMLEELRVDYDAWKIPIKSTQNSVLSIIKISWYST